MKKRLKTAFALLLCCALCASLFAGCSSGDETLNLIYPFSGDVTSYDPQIAATQDDFLIMENVYEGLVRVDDDGTVRPGTAESWEVTDSGRTYTFHLKQGCKWHISDAVKELMGENFAPDVTADDFVFALQRAADPNTQCPLFSSISGIENAQDIQAGKKSVSALGVEATNDYTLVIRLAQADSGFLNTLATAVAAPCNRAFFEATKGRYGLELKYSMFNGQFYVSSELDTSYVLSQNKSYSGPSPTKVTRLTLTINEDRASITKNLLSGLYDAAFLSGHEAAAVQAEEEGITALPYTDTLWSFVFNCSDEFLANSNIRHALCTSFGQADLSETDYLQTATGYIPPSCMTGGSTYRDSAPNAVYTQDTQNATELWEKGLEETDMSTVTLTVLTTSDMEEYVLEVFQDVQASIGKIGRYGSGDDAQEIDFTMKTEVLSESELQSHVAAGNYQLAFMRFQATSDNPYAFIQSINATAAYSSAGTSAFASELQTLAGRSSSEAELCADCEKKILDTYSVCPVFFETSYYASAKNVTGIQFHAGSGRVNFCNAARTD